MKKLMDRIGETVKGHIEEAKLSHDGKISSGKLGYSSKVVENRSSGKVRSLKFNANLH